MMSDELKAGAGFWEQSDAGTQNATPKTHSSFRIHHSSFNLMALTFRARLTLWYVVALGCLLALTAAGLTYALGLVAQKRFDAALWVVGATVATLALLAAASAFLLADRAVRPVEEIASAAESVNARNLKARL